MDKYDRAGRDTDDNIIRRMRLACWISKATHTHRICNNYFFSTATIVTRTYLNVTFVHTLPALCLLNLSNPSAQDNVAFLVSKTLRSN